RRSSGFAFCEVLRSRRFIGIEKQSDMRRLRYDLPQKLKALGREINSDDGMTRHVSARPRERVDQFRTDGVIHENKDNRDCRGRLLRVLGCLIAHSHDGGHIQCRQLCRHLPEALGYLVRKSMLKPDVAALDIAEFLEALN